MYCIAFVLYDIKYKRWWDAENTAESMQLFLFQVVVRLVSGRPGAKHFTDSPLLREFTKATNIRLRFLRTNTLLGHLISKAEKDPTVTRRVSLPIATSIPISCEH